MTIKNVTGEKDARDEPRLTSVNHDQRIQIAPRVGAFRRFHRRLLRLQKNKSANQITDYNVVARHKIVAPPFVIQLARKNSKLNAKLPLRIIKKNSLSLTDQIKPCIAFAHRL